MNYKEILEGVVNIINTTEKSDIGFANICAYIGKNYPELKKNDDERIRKKIINLVKKSNEYGGYALHKQESDEMLAWLEKQGEHANFLSKIQIGDKVTRNEAGILVNISQLNRVAKPTKRRDRQKSTDEEIQNSAWSKEDTEISSMLIELVESKEESMEAKVEFIAWIKSLKDKVLLKPEQEWSEEDERIYRSIIYSFAHNFPLTIQQQEFVKSIKERYTWKPSEEQMKFLLKYAEQNNYDGSILTSLYQDLKKLI